jgi:hypothetical protein
MKGLLGRYATQTVIFIVFIACAFSCTAQSSHGLRTDKYLITRKEFLKKSQTYLLRFTRSGKVYKKVRDVSVVDGADSGGSEGQSEGTKAGESNTSGPQTNRCNDREESSRPQVCGKWQLSPTGTGVSFWVKDGDTVERYSAEVSHFTGCSERHQLL